jgi:Zn finger protein HypA/HybF involved in hydrogenase expression
VVLSLCCNCGARFDQPLWLDNRYYCPQCKSRNVELEVKQEIKYKITVDIEPDES